MPIGGRGDTGVALDQKIAILRERLAEAGRDPDSAPVTIFGAQPNSDTISRMEQYGVSRVLLTVPAEGPETVLPLLDNLAKLVR
jgi:hypothetical protein